MFENIMFKLRTWQPTSLEVFLIGFIIAITAGDHYINTISKDKIKTAVESFNILEQKLIDKEEIIIKRQEGNDNVRYIVKPNTEKQILMYVPVDIKPEEK